MAITILKTTERHALLITDGTRVAWVQGRTHRADGTWTAAALDALANGKTVAEAEAEQKARKEARDKAFAESKLPTTIVIAAERVFDYSPKAWKIRTNAQVRLYGRWCSKYEYLPKSLVSVVKLPYPNDRGAATVELTMPRWFLAKNEWLKAL